ncbi:MAG: hypothetical protein JWQ38_226 [Flavipsychrobacter sp.]|nr:hypothetical protein [Flavipsychrobacter sp.]
MKKQLLTALSIIALSGAAQAQVSFAPELGLNISQYRMSYAGISPSLDARFGLRLGGVADIGFNDNWSVQPGLFYVMNGFNYTETIPFFGTAELKEKINTIEIPVNVMYKFGDPGGNRFFIGAGPIIGMNIGGQQEASFAGLSTSQSLKIGSDSTNSDLKMLDIGVGINLGYELSSGLFFRGRYQMGLSNVAPGGDADNYLKSAGYGVSIGYMFHGKTAKKGTKKGK